MILCGCSSNGTPDNKNQTPTLNDQVIIDGLAESTKAMATSLRILYELRNAKAYQNADAGQRQQWYEQTYHLPESLKLPVTVNGPGDAEKLIRQIARMVRYEVPEPIGKIPADKPIVRIKARARPAYDILRDIGAQTDGRLKIDIMPAEDPTERVRGVIMLEYL